MKIIVNVAIKKITNSVDRTLLNKLDIFSLLLTTIEPIAVENINVILEAFKNIRSSDSSNFDETLYSSRAISLSWNLYVGKCCFHSLFESSCIIFFPLIANGRADHHSV